MVINIFGGPAYGKSTLAAGLFVELKRLGKEVEIVSEFAKDLILEGKADALAHQWFVMANQAYRIQQAAKHFEFVITDSPILMGVVYDRDHSAALEALCLEHHKRHPSLNFLTTVKPPGHSMAGRVHDEEEAVRLNKYIENLLLNNDVPYRRISDRLTADMVLDVK